MASAGRRSTSATASSLAKRHASSSTGSENFGKGATAATALPSQHAPKKRPALANITNQRHGSGPPNRGRNSIPESSKIVSAPVDLFHVLVCMVILHVLCIYYIHVFQKIHTIINTLYGNVSVHMCTRSFLQNLFSPPFITECRSQKFLVQLCWNNWD